MSRKKVKKDVVKRKTNIYDPMGVYGRGLTESQRLGMTRQMKIENIRDSGKVVTKKDLEEYQRTLIYYGIPTVLKFGIKTINIYFPLDEIYTNITNETINEILHDQYGIHANTFYCDSFSIERDKFVYDTWYPIIRPFIVVGSEGLTFDRSGEYAASDRENYIVTFPSYWIGGVVMNYYDINYDATFKYASVAQALKVIEGDFTLLPNDRTSIPYLMFPNDKYPEMRFGVNFLGEVVSGFRLVARIRVIY